jgi:hypothetical protein
MKFQTKLKVIAAFVTGLAAASSAQATSKDVSASVVVNNTIDMTVAADLDLGTISALADTSTGATISTMVMSADPATAPLGSAGTDSAIIVLQAGSPADIVVAGAAPNYNLTVTLPAGPILMEDPSITAGSGMAFNLGTFTRYSYVEGNNQSFASTTDATGNLAFYVGATLSTANVNGNTVVSDPYTEGVYTATFPVVVEY